VTAIRAVVSEPVAAAGGGLSTGTIHTLLRMFVFNAGECAAARTAAAAAMARYLNSPRALEILGRPSITPGWWAPTAGAAPGADINAEDVTGMRPRRAVARFASWFR
jgi:hypothetical protein